MVVYKVFPCPGCSPHCEDSIKSAIFSIETWLQEGSVGDLVSVRIIEMGEDEYNALPEYQGP